MLYTTYKALERISQCSKYTSVSKYISDSFDCLSMLYHVAGYITKTKEGTYRFLVSGYNNFEVLNDFFVSRHFAFSSMALMNGDFEITVDIGRLIWKLNKAVNEDFDSDRSLNGLRKSASSSESSV